MRVGTGGGWGQYGDRVNTVRRQLDEDRKQHRTKEQQSFGHDLHH